MWIATRAFSSRLLHQEFVNQCLNLHGETVARPGKTDVDVPDVFGADFEIGSATSFHEFFAGDAIKFLHRELCEVCITFVIVQVELGMLIRYWYFVQVQQRKSKFQPEMVIC